MPRASRSMGESHHIVSHVCNVNHSLKSLSSSFRATHPVTKSLASGVYGDAQLFSQIVS